MRPLEFAHYVLDHVEAPTDQFIDNESVRRLAMAHVLLSALHTDTAGQLVETDALFINAAASASADRVVEHGRFETILRARGKAAVRAMLILTVFTMLCLTALTLAPH